MSTTAKMTPKAAASKLKRTTSQTLVKQGRKLDMENYCAPGVRDLWMPMSIFLLNLATICLGIYRLDKVGVDPRCLWCMPCEPVCCQCELDVGLHTSTKHICSLYAGCLT